MNLEINIKVPLGAAGASITQPVMTGQAVEVTQQPVPHDAFPPALDPGRSLPWGEPQRLAPNAAGTVPPEAAPPSLAEMGIAFDPPQAHAPPSLQELGIGSGFPVSNGGLTREANYGTPPGLEGLDLTTAPFAAFEPPPPPELELEAQATADVHAPPLPEELIRQMRANKAAAPKPRKE